MSGAPILLAGPTASGKSALAMTLARALGGVVVNADSQQVFAEWRVLSARPSPEDEAAVPHRLYGHVGVAEPYSVGRWLDEVRMVMAEAGTVPSGPEAAGGGAAEEAGVMSPRHRDVSSGAGDSTIRGLRPIVIGGTGLYFRALTEGLSPIPDVPTQVRAAGEAMLERLGLQDFAMALARRDPETAAGLDLANPRRVLRAWEVLEASGIGLAEWKARTPPPLVPLERAVAVALVPSRDWLYARCDARLDAMIAEGVLEEVARVMALGVARSAPAMKAVGAAEFGAHLVGELTLEEAAARAKTETRRYAKRQLTWIRNQMKAWHRQDPAAPDLVKTVLALVRD